MTPISSGKSAILLRLLKEGHISLAELLELIGSEQAQLLTDPPQELGPGTASVNPPEWGLYADTSSPNPTTNAT